MNAIQFIKEKGVDKAREVVSKHAECYMPEVFKYWSEQLHDYVLAPKYAASLVSDLKRLVDSLDLIKFYNGIEKANFLLEMSNRPSLRPPHPSEVKLKQAIADYDEIYSGEGHV